jgi:4-aminobutyrate aminotransferase and related aminotransferases
MFYKVGGLHWGAMTDTLSQAPASTSARIVTEIPGPRSRELHERRVKTVSAGVAATFPIYAAHAHNAVIEDVDGNRFIDFTGGIGVMTVGHTNDAVVAAVADQAAKVTHTLFAVAGYEPYIAVCDCSRNTRPETLPKSPCW